MISVEVRVAEFEVEEATQRRNGSMPVLPAAASAPHLPPSETSGWIQDFLAELDVYYRTAKLFHEQQPDEVLSQCSAISARLTEMRAMTQRSSASRAASVRTREIDPLIAQIDFQFKVHSRLLTQHELDWRMTGGAPS